MRFDPQTLLERLLVRAQDAPTDPNAYRAFAAELMSTTLGVVTRPAPHGFQPELVAAGGPTGSSTPGVCVFSHPLRFDTFTNDVMLPGPDWQVRPEPARALFEWAVHNDLTVRLNPGSSYGKEFPPAELFAFLRGQWV